jgi:hypothetical protein
LVAHLADVRRRATCATDELTRLRREADDHFAATHATRLTERALLVGQLETLERDVRVDALLLHKATGDKKPVPGVEIVIGRQLDYDLPDALAWAKETGLALTLDVKTFEALAKSLTPPPKGVTIADVPKVRIASDLAAALTKGGAA